MNEMKVEGSVLAVGGPYDGEMLRMRHRTVLCTEYLGMPVRETRRIRVSHEIEEGDVTIETVTYRRLFVCLTDNPSVMTSVDACRWFPIYVPHDPCEQGPESYAREFQDLCFNYEAQAEAMKQVRHGGYDRVGVALDEISPQGMSTVENVQWRGVPLRGMSRVQLMRLCAALLTDGRLTPDKETEREDESTSGRDAVRSGDCDRGPVDTHPA